MNKYQQLTKQIIKHAIKAGILLAIAGSVYAAASYYEEGTIKRKAAAEAKFAQDDALLTNFRGQMDKSGEAEKNFVQLQGTRNTQDFSESFDVFQNFLIKTKDRYRISAEIKLAKEEPTNKAELKNFVYDVLVRQNLELTVKAISDAHLFAFIHDLETNAPGLVRINKFELKRVAATADLTDESINKLKIGTYPLLIEGTIDLTWIRLVPKAVKPTAADASAPKPAP